MDWWGAFVDVPDAQTLVRTSGRLAIAALFGGLIGLERERLGKAAGLRTHMLVSLGAALFVLVPSEVGMERGDLTRVIQGIATGVGFIGAGTILKRSDREEDIQGLTSAAAIWLTGAVGIAVGAGQALLAGVSVLSAWLILAVVGVLTRRLPRQP